MDDIRPPYNRTAEEAVLGSMMRDNAVIGEVLLLVRAEDFYVDAHQRIFKAALELYRQGQPVDTVTLADCLKNEIQDVGSYDYLGDLWNAAPMAANAEHYARIVRDGSICRSLIHQGTEIVRDAYDQAMAADDLLESAERKILAIGDAAAISEIVTLADTLYDMANRVDAICTNPGKPTGLSTGFVNLDEKLGGLQGSELLVIAARPRVGKTQFALNLVQHIAINNEHPVFFVSLEQSRREINDRIACAYAGVDSHGLRRGELRPDEVEKLSIAMSELGPIGKQTFFLDDAGHQTMLRIAANARRLKLQHGIRAVFVDYLQLIEPETRKGKSRQEQVAEISGRLKKLAKELSLPVVALAQLNRDSEGREDKKPRLSDLRESGAIEQDADTVILLHRPELYNPGEKHGLAELEIAKQRNGPMGEVELCFESRFGRFTNPRDF